MQIFGTQILAALLSYGNGDLLRSLECEHCSLETAFDTNVHVEASVSYPKLLETSMLTHFANESIRKEALDLYDAFVREMSLPQKEFWEEEGDERTFYYGLDLVCCSGDLTSFYGDIYQYRGGVHGSVRYITKTFWQNDGSIYELKLSDLFLPKYKDLQFLLQYCENYFKSRKWGYYIYEEPGWPELRTDDLETFVFTEKGLLFIFQNYVLDGWNDDPITLLIPYTILAPFVNPNSLISTLMESELR